jgi:NB-ARC domain
MVGYQRNPYLQGRDSLLRQLKEKLFETRPKKFNHRIAIFGLGGVGKTQVAIEYVYRNKAEYNSIFWINASDQAAFFSGFQDIATKTERVSIEGQNKVKKPSDIVNGVLSWLAEQDRWLLVIDNLDDISIAKDYLPSIKEGGHVLITTRNPDALSIPAEGIQVPLLEENDAIELLYNRCNLDELEYPSDLSEKASAVELVHELGYLPLAIEQASGYIRSSLKSISKFLPTFRAYQRQLLDRIPTGTSYPVSLCYDSSIDREIETNAIW